MQNNIILITGGAGFIGSHLVKRLVLKYPQSKIINLDVLTYAADISRLREIINNDNYYFIEGDIRDESLVQDIFKQHKVNGVLHLAAESHVDNSITSPKIFVETNILGTQNLLDAAKNLWMKGNGQLNRVYQNAKFLHVSTDEVYGSLGDTGYFTETTPYAPNSPYSASKASSDLLARSYFHTYGMPIVISNCSNNYGPWQHDEKLIPTIIRKALAGQKIPIYGDGANIRDWLYVDDHCIAMEDIFQQGKPGESYNVGSSNEQNNLDLTRMICKLLDNIKPKAEGNYSELISFVKDRAGHDYRYAIDPDKITRELGWKPKYSFGESLEKTVKWYVENYTK